MAMGSVLRANSLAIRRWLGLLVTVLCLLATIRSQGDPARPSPPLVNSVGNLWLLVSARHALGALPPDEQVVVLGKLAKLVSPPGGWKSADEYSSELRRVRLNDAEPLVLVDLMNVMS